MYLLRLVVGGLGLSLPLDTSGNGDVLPHRLPRQQLVEFLEDHHAVRVPAA